MGFQIPGLGFAKPNEKLPPLSASKSTSGEDGSEAISPEGDKEPKQTPASPAVSQQDTVMTTATPDEPVLTQPDSGTDPDTNQHVDSQLPQEVPSTSLVKPNEASSSDSSDDSSEDSSDESSGDETVNGPSITDALEAAIGGLPATSKGTKRAAEEPGSTWQNEGDRTKVPEWEFDSSPLNSDDDEDDNMDGPADERYVPMTAAELRKHLAPGEDGDSDSDDATQRAKGPNSKKKPAVNTKGSNKQTGQSKPVPKAVKPPKDGDASSSGSEADSDDDMEYANVTEALASLNHRASSKESEEPQATPAAVKPKKVATKNELDEPVLPKPEVEITPNDTLCNLGQIMHCLGHQVMVRAGSLTMNVAQMVLEQQTAVFTKERELIGAVADIIGSTRNPIYIVHVDEETRSKLNLEAGTPLFYVERFAQRLDTNALRAVKGSDASNQHDEEVDWAHRDFSDDEEERAHKEMRNKHKRGDKASNARGGSGGGRGRGGNRSGPSFAAGFADQTSAPGSSVDVLSYDDGPYTPLARPTGYGEQQPQQQNTPPPYRGSHHSGRGRGRGRGGAGRERGGHQQHGRGYSPVPHTSPPQSHGPYHQQAPQAYPPVGFTAGQPYANPQTMFQANSPPVPTGQMPFPFPFPPPPPTAQADGRQYVPPPPPGWPVQPQQGGQQANYYDPATLQAFISQMPNMGNLNNRNT